MSEKSLHERLCDPDDHPVLVSPLAGWTDSAYRKVLRQCGAKHLCIPFISAYALEQSDIRERYRREIAAEKCQVQIFGNKADVCAGAASMLEEAGAPYIDFNCGCSVRKIHRGGGGSALLKDLDSLEKILRAIREAVNVPVSFKTRIGFMQENDTSGLEACRMAQDIGYSWITLHGRTANQGFGGEADWKPIAQLADELDIPVIGNGDVVTPDDVRRMIDETGCAGVMLGRSVMGNPWIAGDCENFLRTGERARERTRSEIVEVMLLHQDSLIELYGDLKGLREFRKHIAKYLRGFAQAAKVRSVLVRTDDSETVYDILRNLGDGRPVDQIIEFDVSE